MKLAMIMVWFCNTLLAVDQLVIPFNNVKTFEHGYKDQSIVIRVADSSPADFEKLDHYDDTYIRRLIIKDVGNSITEVKILLRDDKIKSTIYSFEEPFRIVIDLYKVDESSAISNKVSPVVRRSKMKITEIVDENDKKFTKYVSNWGKYPEYIYKIGILPFLNTKRKKIKSSATAAKAAQAFNKGDDAQAMHLYQKVLAKNSKLVANSPSHLWRFAETHFGAGNLTLADGYYQTFIYKYGGHPLANYARMRRLDTVAVRSGASPDLLFQLEKINPKNDKDLKAQLLLRKGYWGQSAKDDFPIVDNKIAMDLLDTYPNVKSEKTRFLASSIAIKTLLHSKNLMLKPLSQYLSKFNKKSYSFRVEPVKSQITTKFREVFSTSIRDFAKDKKFISMLDLFESIPNNLKNYVTDPNTVQIIADAYQFSARPEQATELYRTAASQIVGDEELLETLVKMSITASQAVYVRKISGKPTQSYSKIAKSSDNKALRLWTNISDKDAFFVKNQKLLLDFSLDDYTLQTPALMVLDVWGKNVENGKNTSAATYSPVKVLLSLSDKFQKLGLTDQRDRSLDILRKVKPNGDAEKVVWSQSLVKLASDYRKQNRYLDAGRTYTAAGIEGVENRASHLYKGGLLLYRGGNREEALSAFEKCSGDGNNLYYANLCKERLDRLNNN